MLTKAKNHLPAQLLTPAIKFTRSTAALSNETAKAVFLAKNVVCNEASITFRNYNLKSERSS